MCAEPSTGSPIRLTRAAKLHQNLARDIPTLRFGRIDGGVLTFWNPSHGVGRGVSACQKEICSQQEE